MLDKHLQEHSGLEKELPGYITYSLRQKIPDRLRKVQYTMAFWLKSAILILFELIQGLVCSYLPVSLVQGHWCWLAAPLCTPGSCSSESAPYSTFWPIRMLQLDSQTHHKSAHFAQHHEAAHFHSLQHCSLLPGPLKAPFTQGSLAGKPTATEHEEQIRAGNTIPQIKPLSVWKDDWDLPECLLSSAHKDLNLFAISPSPWVSSLWQAGMGGRVGQPSIPTVLRVL